MGAAPKLTLNLLVFMEIGLFMMHYFLAGIIAFFFSRAELLFVLTETDPRSAETFHVQE